jgi:hypothetical protein
VNLTGFSYTNFSMGGYEANLCFSPADVLEAIGQASSRLDAILEIRARGP